MTTVRLCSLDDLVEGTASRIDIDGVRLAVARIGDDVFCVADRCSHEDFSLSEGEVMVADKEIECARHGAMFDLTTGEPRSFPATKPIATYVATVRDGEVEVELP
ncbi:MAG: non-heme iron oxygenase ferredoxin subunit [Actinomycetes bacterium]